VHASPSASVGTSVPLIDNSQQTNEDVGVRMYSSLMGRFDFMEPIHHIHVISSESSSSMKFVPLCTSHFNDPWNLPSPTIPYEGQSHIGMEIPLSTVEVVYQSIFEAIADPDPSSSWNDEVDPILELVWAAQSSCSHDFLNDTLPLDETILEDMYGLDRTWDDMHHRSYFLSDLVKIKQDDFRSTLSEMVGHTVLPLDTHGICFEGNMENISPTIMIDISCIPRKIENIYIGVDCLPEEIQIYIDLFKTFRDVFTCSYEDMPGIDPIIVEHDIKKYPDVKPI
jgi:hypothetical protein